MEAAPSPHRDAEDPVNAEVYKTTRTPMGTLFPNSCENVNPVKNNELDAGFRF